MIKSKNSYDMKTEYLICEKIITEYNCENTELLLKDAPRQALLADVPTVKIKKGGYVLLDFGKEIHGGAVISVKNANKFAKMRIVFGESVMEALSRIGEKNSANDHAIRDMCIDIADLQTFKTSSTGFRFFKLEAVSDDVELSCVQAYFEHRDLEYKGSFECDDELLNKIWDTGAYTVFLNMQEYIFEGIKRDRLIWVGDMHPEISTILNVFGADSSIRKSLELVENVTPPDKWMVMKTYTMWWVKIQLDMYIHTGDREYLEKKKDYLFKVLEHILQTVASELDADMQLPHGEFIDWSSFETPYTKAGYNAMLITALNSGVELCGVLENYSLQKECEKVVKILRKNSYDYSGNKQIAALTALSNETLSEKICKDVLLKDGACGLSPFMGYYVLIALAENGYINEALKLIKDYWGRMLELGATTFWECFDIKEAEGALPITEIVPSGAKDIHGDFGINCFKGYRKSLCHGWSSGPTAFLSEYVLGIKKVEAGFKKIRISPNLGNLKYAKGTVPTPYGVIKIEHRVENGKIITNSEIPQGIILAED